MGRRTFKTLKLLGSLYKTRTKEIQVTLVQIGDNYYTDIREYVTTNRGFTWEPTVKGICIKVDDISILINLLKNVLKALEEFLEE